MSNYLAIAATTATLKHLLNDAIVSIGINANVDTVGPAALNADSGKAGINLFLYQVTTNAALRNIDLPTRRSDGSLSKRPQLALNLNYLLTFYGKEDELEPQRLLGAAVSLLHECPVLKRETIETVIEKRGHPDPGISASDLADQPEFIKFTLLSLDLEELSKLWSVFFQTSYSLSVAYQASVVLIEGRYTPIEKEKVGELVIEAETI